MSEYQYEQQEPQTEVYTNGAEVEIQKEWRWVSRLPGYGGEYSQQINDMAQDYQQAVNLEIEAWRIRNGQEPGADGTLDISAQDQAQAQSLRAQAHELRVESVGKAGAIAQSIKSRWNEQQIGLARAGDKQIVRAQPYSRDMNRDIQR
ncbi:hypothetical protein [Eoetvoesiella caeni]